MEEPLDFARGRRQIWRSCTRPEPWDTPSALKGSGKLPFSLKLWYYQGMAKSASVLPRKKGRPFEGGRDPVTAIRLSWEMRNAIDAWAAEQLDRPSRSEAIRQMIDHALDTWKKKATR